MYEIGRNEHHDKPYCDAVSGDEFFDIEDHGFFELEGSSNGEGQPISEMESSSMLDFQSKTLPIGMIAFIIGFMRFVALPALDRPYKVPRKPLAFAMKIRVLGTWICAVGIALIFLLSAAPLLVPVLFRVSFQSRRRWQRLWYYTEVILWFLAITVVEIWAGGLVLQSLSPGQ